MTKKRLALIAVLPLTIAVICGALAMLPERRIRAYGPLTIIDERSPFQKMLDLIPWPRRN
jgi:hypothetical protein